MTEIAATAAALALVTLDTPLKRGEATIESVQVRKPQSGELRGLSLSQLLNLDYGALETLLPRITIPMLSKQDVAALDPADLTQLGSEVMDFLLPKGAKAGLSPVA
ncbi:phage tail assembly protein [Novosphingobium sp. P6W]|uniref:phage tail assembly protein n=1 Tax=Novosphingobium sp. P6W TaxID=1609758 RepID=UPI0005C2CE8F|nr:phage tail assembly protein [Novosphingobium sp. P6W]AXB75461.1 phage tail assembly protein [Novosphingobium sp. P6W]KIS32512.1 tail E family protein [Novosphingobium sp. P6W]